ncbi:TrmB family transcriptional regulator [Longispora albida]|uniref:TrmB family transcriptional regulator n=1 Tax=Longispora albida TaxID=203523 RepID=UPI00035C21EC|nr:helix-turn-helix domain-containing protein [Longispora albida]
MIDRLTELGFSSQEARVYVALLEQPLATGYEVAKHAGMPRANVYQVLGTLADRGVVTSATQEGPARYVACPPADVLGRIKQQTAERADSLIADLSAIAAPEEQAAYTLRDRDAVTSQVLTLVAEARRRVALCLTASDLTWLAGPLRAASEAGCQVVVNVSGDESSDLAFAEVYRHEPAARSVGGHVLTLATDHTTALVASFDEPVGAVYTRHPALVWVVEKLIRDETYMAAIYERLGPQLEAEFGPHLVQLRARLLPPEQARQLISIVGFGAGGEGIAALLDPAATTPGTGPVPATPEKGHQ